MGFSSFFEKANLAGHMPKVISCGARQNAFEKFHVALMSRKEEEFIVLLVDSEDPVGYGTGPWEHLERRDGWGKPLGATDERVHLMVQCMEAWFFTDTDSLAEYFGRDFNRNTLPRRREVEEIAKDEIFRKLRSATQRCAKGRYGKGRHSFDILARVDPAMVFAVSPYSERLITTLREKAT